MSSIDQILAGYESLRAGQEAFYKDLHRHPELSHQEHRTAWRVADQLQSDGFTVQTGGQLPGRVFVGHFGDNAMELPRQTVSEDFSKFPAAAGVPYTYCGLGFTARETYLTAEKAGRLEDLPANHSPRFLPPLQPSLRTGTEALITAALVWLAT